MRETITIQGLEFSVHSPYQEGHPLTAEEASVLNQTFHENLRNNFAGYVKDARNEHGDDLPQNVLAELQKEFEDYAREYKFGTRRAGTRAPADPVEAEAFKMAKEAIRLKLKEKGRSAAAAQIADAAATLLSSEKGEAYRTAAKRRVQEAQKIASESLQDILDSIPEPTDGNGADTDSGSEGAGRQPQPQVASAAVPPPPPAA